MNGKLIQNKLKELGITQIELAEKLGVSQPAVNSYFNSKDIRTSTLEKFCDVLDLKINDFYEGTDYGITIYKTKTEDNDTVSNLALTVKEQIQIIKQQEANIKSLIQIIDNLNRDKEEDNGADPKSGIPNVG